MKVIDWLDAYSIKTKCKNSPSSRRRGVGGEVPKYITVLLSPSLKRATSENYQTNTKPVHTKE